jgi:Tol biopolymer transport system component
MALFRRARATVLVAVAMVALSCTGPRTSTSTPQKTPAATPTPKPIPPGTLVFTRHDFYRTSYVGDGWVLWRVNPDGTTARGLHRLVRVDDAAWSPDQQRIVYIPRSSHAIWVMSADGIHKRQLTHPKPGFEDIQPAWSRNGRKLIAARRNTGSTGGYFLGDRNNTYVTGSGPGAASLVIVDIATGRERLLAKPIKSSGHSFGEPTFSPDGRFVAATIGSPSKGIMLVSTTNGSVERLSSTFDRSPSWSPDGRHIAVSRLPKQESGPARWGEDIVVVNVQTKKARMISKRPAVPPSPKISCGGGGSTIVHNQWPKWSPDGARIAYMSNRARLATDLGEDIFVSKFTGGEPRKVWGPEPPPCAGGNGPLRAYMELQDWAYALTDEI